MSSCRPDAPRDKLPKGTTYDQELPVTVANGRAAAQVSHFSSGFIAADSSFATDQSYWWVQVDGINLRVPCPELDQDFTKPGSTGLFVGTSRSTNVQWGVDFPRDVSTLLSGAATGTYPIVGGGLLAAEAADLLAFEMEVPVSTGSGYYTTVGAPVSATSYDRITKIQLVSSTSTTATFRLWGAFQATMVKPGGGMYPAQGGWSLLVTYPAPVGVTCNGCGDAASAYPGPCSATFSLGPAHGTYKWSWSNGQIDSVTYEDDVNPMNSGGYTYTYDASSRVIKATSSHMQNPVTTLEYGFAGGPCLSPIPMAIQEPVVQAMLGTSTSPFGPEGGSFVMNDGRLWASCPTKITTTQYPGATNETTTVSTYTYTSDGKLLTVTPIDVGSTEYRPATCNEVDTYTFQGGANGLTGYTEAVAFPGTYSPTGAPCSKIAGPGYSIAWSFQTDSAGRIVSFSSGSNNNAPSTLTFDTSGRLTSRSSDGSVAGNYTYDANGNLIGYVVPGGASLTLDYSCW